MPVTIILGICDIFQQFLIVETTILEANAMISSRLDYSNSLLYGDNKASVSKHQKAHNTLMYCLQTG